MNRLHCIATNDRKSTQNGGTVTYNHHNSNKISIVKEDSRLCDGIGGVIWDGALLMAFLLEELIPIIDDTSIIELGAGAGLTSIVSEKCITSETVNVICTDRYIDLLDINITNNNLSNKIISAVLDWEHPEEAYLHKHIKKNVIVIGVEIACLVKQQQKLINTIKNLCNDNINSTILITFDETTENESNYEKQFIELMTKEGYISAIIFTGSIEWHQNETIAYVHDITNRYHHDLNLFAFPGNNRNDHKVIKTSKEEPPPIPKASNSDSNNNNHRSTVHHVIAFYQVELTLSNIIIIMINYT